MSSIVLACGPLVLFVFLAGAAALYRLSSWLESWDYQRHFED